MGLNIIEKIQARLELFRLEQRYTRNRNRRSTFVSNALYVDGEYIYNTPNTTGSSADSKNSSPAIEAKPTRIVTAVGVAELKKREERKKLNRWSSMPGFGSSANSGSGTDVSGGEWPRRRGSLDRRR